MSKNLAPIKQRVMQYLDYKGIKKIDFFDKTSISASNFKSNGLYSELGGDKIAEILSFYHDLDSTWLITGVGNMIKQLKYRDADVKPSITKESPTKYNAIKEVPLYDFTASAGVVEIFNDSNSAIPMDHIKIPDLPDCDGAIHINGDSMYPLLKSGDIIMYKQVNNKENIIWGEMYLMYINNHGDEFFFVKYVQKSDKEGYVKLVSQNQHHQPVEFPIDSIKQIAIVKASVRINSRV